jgi:hypothetical protein
VSAHTDDAWYQQEEIVRALELARDKPETHTVIPVILDEQSRGPACMPYGVSILQALDATQPGGLQLVATELYAWRDTPLLGVESPTAADTTVKTERWKKYYTEVVAAVAAKLKRLSEETLKQVAREINTLAEEMGQTGINLDLTHQTCAEATAACIVSHTAVTDVVGCLVGLLDEVGQDADKVADIIDYVLPLNYAPDVVHRLYEHLAANQLGLIDNEVATRTLAEIIMAGYDQKPAKFATLTQGNTDVRGKTALDHCDGPEEGPGHGESESVGVLRVACNLLSDLLALQGTLCEAPYQRPQRTPARVLNETELQSMMQRTAIELRGELTSVSKSNNRRTVYCVLPLPSEGIAQREFCKKVIAVVHHHVPQLIFVELMQTPTDEREFEVRGYIRARVIRTQHIRKP